MLIEVFSLGFLRGLELLPFSPSQCAKRISMAYFIRLTF